VIEDLNGDCIALPPTEIIKKEDLFNYRAKYLPGISRKVTPMNASDDVIEKIRRECIELYQLFGFEVYARIDGILKNDGTIFLNDPNTTSGMMPSSFFFHQAAEIGLNPSQFLTFIIYKSIQKRMENGYQYQHCRLLLNQLEDEIKNKITQNQSKDKVAVVMGGNSSERHISIESGRNVFEKLSSSGKYDVTPILLTDNGNENYQFHILPINLLLKDNADDIRDKSFNYKPSPIIEKIVDEAKNITEYFGTIGYNFYPTEISLSDLKLMVDFVFIGLHGRPGEDGALQKQLEQVGLPYNGSGIGSSSITINKYITNELLSQHGLLTPNHLLINKSDYISSKETLITNIEKTIPYPLIAKPADDGCSSAVKKVNNQTELINYLDTIFRDNPFLNENDIARMDLMPNEEFPFKDFFVVEELISPNNASHFIEITGGMLTHRKESGEIVYEVFEPSEALASKGILSLEEKFLAGEGQNITPSRFDKDVKRNADISAYVREELKKAAIILNIEGYCRIDAFVRIFNDKSPEVIFIEVNSLPGLTPATCIFHQAAINNYKPIDFLSKIIDYGKTSILA
jgi:D-alanine-D-alanine ligase